MPSWRSNSEPGVADWLEPVYDAEGMSAADRWASSAAGVPSLELMEAAGRALADGTARLAGPGPIRIVCGKGNNGGDGLVAARHLAGSGFEVEALLPWPAAELSSDAAANLGRLEGSDRARVREGEVGDPELDGSGAVVDAVFGTGFSGEPRPPAAGAIEAIGRCDAPVIACDTPSGVDASTGEASGATAPAELTVTFHGLKVGHLIAPGKGLCGEVEVAPIGIPDGGPSGEAAGVIGLGALDLPPVRGASSNKFSSGKVVIVGASPGLTGAVCLAAGAAARAGAGYATVAVPGALEAIFEQKLTEVMSIGIGEGLRSHEAGHVDEVLAACERAAAVVVGSGIGRNEPTLALVRELCGSLEMPLVLDADGLSAYAGGAAGLSGRPGPTVLTPHPGEMGRLLGRDSGEVGAHRLACAKELARAASAVVVLKGDDSIVTDGERVAINRLAAPALATAGTGDVLAGVCGALLARGLGPFEATAAAVLAHARAGRAAATRIGTVESVIASDVIESLPAGLRRRLPVE